MADFRRTRDYQPDSPLELQYLNDPSYTPLDQLGGRGMRGAGNDSFALPAGDIEGRLETIQQLGDQRRGLEDQLAALRSSSQPSQGLDLGGMWQGIKDAGSAGLGALGSLVPSQDTMNNIGMRLQNMGASYYGQTPLYMKQQQHAMEMGQHEELMAMKREQMAMQLQQQRQSMQNKEWDDMFGIITHPGLTDPQRMKLLKAKSGSSQVAFDAAQSINEKMLGSFNRLSKSGRLPRSEEEYAEGLKSGQLNWEHIAADIKVGEKSEQEEAQALAAENAQQRKIQGLIDKLHSNPESLTDTEVGLLDKYNTAKQERAIKLQELKGSLTKQSLDIRKAQREDQAASVMPQYGPEVHTMGGNVQRERFDPQTGQLSMVSGTKPPPIQVNTKVDLEKGKSLAHEVGDIVKGTRDKAVGAVSMLNTAHRIDTALQSGKINLGPTATVRQFMDRLSDTLGVAGKTKQERLANTRNTIKGLAEFALAARDQLKGTGQISNYEQELIGKAETGDLTEFSPSELSSFLRIVEKGARLNYGLHEQQLRNMSSDKDDAIRGLVPYYSVPSLPKELPKLSSLPKGIPEGSEQVGTFRGKPVYKSPDGKKWIEE